MLWIAIFRGNRLIIMLFKFHLFEFNKKDFNNLSLGRGDSLDF